MARALGSGEGLRGHRLPGLWLHSGLATLPITDAEQGGVVFCPTTSCFAHVRTCHVDAHDAVCQPPAAWQCLFAAPMNFAFTDFELRD
jgi:hypothetical protein